MKLSQITEPKTKEFVKKIYSKAHRNPLGRGVIFEIGKGDDSVMVTLEMVAQKGNVHISEIIVLEGKTGTGFGNTVLKFITDEADKQNISLTLIASPIKMNGYKNTPKAKLKQFYKKHGFKIVGGDHMKREPE